MYTKIFLKWNVCNNVITIHHITIDMTWLWEHLNIIHQNTLLKGLKGISSVFIHTRKNVYGQNAWIITISAEDYIHLYVTDHLDAVDIYIWVNISVHTATVLILIMIYQYILMIQKLPPNFIATWMLHLFCWIAYHNSNCVIRWWT